RGNLLAVDFPGQWMGKSLPRTLTTAVHNMMDRRSRGRKIIHGRCVGLSTVTHTLINGH
ncbi:hypothetical protein SK128_022887, partial [Halocaridina rubra]